LNTVKNIAFTLPFPYKLYVKEHPASVGLRPKSFYKKFKKLPNVVLISPEENIESIIKKSSGIITLTSTVGMEAALVGKPVYVLGNVSYSYHPLCRKPRNFEDLKNNIEKDLVDKINTDNLEDINCRFIISSFRNTIHGSIVSASREKDINDYKLIYEKIKSYAISK
jgi:capsule polysaccharide modification protein KpsS